ncbi:hypothetical protein CRN80_27395 [Pseudomonas sp. FDAARGOS_380]|nr:hypothetical protein CRN80_27395 [Pseudomonas sp. FDAARGOS_380]
MLAKDVNDNACFLGTRGVCEFFASKLAPTGGGAVLAFEAQCQVTRLPVDATVQLIVAPHPEPMSGQVGVGDRVFSNH